MLLLAERSWLAPRVAQSERVLWLGPAQVFPAFDRAPSMLHLYPSDAGSVRGDLEAPLDQWPLQDESIDHVVFQHPLESRLPLQHMLGEALRVLKPESQLWIFASARASLCRLRLSAALRAERMWPPAAGIAQTESWMRASGCAQIERHAFSGVRDGLLNARASWAPWPPLVLLEARKRRSALILRPRGINEFATGRMQPMPALPASRVGLAA